MSRKNKEKNKENNKEKNFKKIKYIFVLFIVLFVFLGIYCGIFISRWKNLALDIINFTPSIVLDSDEKIIANVGSEKNRKVIDKTEIPEYLKKAYVAIEDERFYNHSGVDIKRTSAAILNYITKSSSTFGGSTITQQLVKNITGDRENSISRKVSEWIRAFSLECFISKEEILEAYLNIIYVGPNIYGVELGSNYYFNKSAKDLSLLESAYLAGINHAPNAYSPFEETDNTEKISKRVSTVLLKMNELGYISKEEYGNAISELSDGIKFNKGIVKNNSSNIYSYHTDALLSELINDISYKNNISTDFATNYIEMGGLIIYSTQNSNIQKQMEKEFANSKYIIKSKKDSSITSQAAMVIIDHTTGNVVGCIGGLGEKDVHRGFNRATQAIRQTGSASKPLAVLAPAIDKKIITPTTKIVDEPTTFEDNTEEGYSPINYNNYLGEITVRRAVESSQNIPFVKIMEQVTPKTAISYMEKMGISTLTETDENINLALGGLDKGISPLEMASAYSTIANNGIYIEPSFYTKVINSNSKTILKSSQKRYRVFSESVSYILTSLLTQPVNGQNGTATYCSINNIDVAAKTGTTNENYDRWLCGFTPYYTAVSWYGFDMSETIEYNHRNPAGLLWSAVMRNIHSTLPSASFSVPKSGIETVVVCSDTGLCATEACKNTYTEYFLDGTVPVICNH